MGWNVIPFDVPNFRSENGKADGACAHWMAALGGEHLSRLRGAVFCE